MKLATVLRYVELGAEGPDAVWNTRYYIGNGYKKWQGSTVWDLWLL